MPLKHGRKASTIRKNISRNIATERRAGYSAKQAAAIAYSTARSDAKKAGVRMKGLRKGRKKK